MNYRYTPDEIGQLNADNDRLRWALEEIIQAADPGPSPWVVINSDLIDKARAALATEPPK